VFFRPLPGRVGTVAYDLELRLRNPVPSETGHFGSYTNLHLKNRLAGAVLSPEPVLTYQRRSHGCPCVGHSVGLPPWTAIEIRYFEPRGRLISETFSRGRMKMTRPPTEAASASISDRWIISAL
jgi:hypothetical protein